MNKLRRMFFCTPEEEKEDIRFFEGMIQKLKDDKHCKFCIHAEERQHYEMGCEAGTDVYCNVFKELRLDYPTGQQCLFWKMKE